MQYVYLLLNLFSLSFPLLYSIYKKEHLYIHKIHFIISTTVIASLFLLWDAYFTSKGVWGFNPKYCIGIFFLKMPIEEWLFFFCIPFASLFIHYLFVTHAPAWKLNNKFVKALTWLLLLLCIVMVFRFYSLSYTVYNFCLLAITLLLAIYNKYKYLNHFYISFLFIFIPFFVINGILTGSFITEPVVWYNNNENLQIRLATIPIEDIGYAFSMLFLNCMLFEKLKPKTNIYMRNDHVILVDVNDNVLGTMSKLQAHEEGKLHRAFSIFILNDKKELLIQKRAYSKYHSAGLWSNTCCSHPQLGETIIDAANRRLHEELGFTTELQIAFSFIYKATFENGLTEHELDYVLLGTYNKEPIKNIDEVDDYTWIPLEKLKKDIIENSANYTVWFQIIFDKFYTYYINT